MTYVLSAQDIAQDVTTTAEKIIIRARFEATDLASSYGDIIKSLYTGTQRIIFDYAAESFFCTSSMPQSSNDIYYNRLHELIDCTGIPYEKFEFYSGNILNNSMYECWRNHYNITNKISNVGFRLQWAYVVKKFHNLIIDQNTGIKPLYFCCFNASPRRHRILAVKLLWDYKMFNKGIITLVSADDGLKKFLYKEGYSQLADILPLSVDGHKDFTHIQPHGGNFKQGFYESFNQTYFDFITETMYGESHGTSALDNVLEENTWWQEIFFSEKTFRSFYYKRPFILFSSAHSLKYLKELGFKTFDCIFDESYDTIEPWEQRLISIVKQINDLCKTNTLEEIHNKIQSNEVQSILEHNYNRFIELADRSSIVNLQGTRTFTEIEKSL